MNDRNNHNITLLLVDDHAIVRAGYRTLLAKQSRLRIIAEAEDGETAYRLYRQLEPDIVIMDISLPGQSGLETLTRIKHRDPAAKVLIFTLHQNPSLALQACRAGALGYITKSSAPDVLLDALFEVYAGRLALSPDITRGIALQQLGGGKMAIESLTVRELEIFRLLAEGRNHNDIAKLLNISPKTVSNCHSLLKQKLNVINDVELTHLAINLNLINS